MSRNKEIDELRSMLKSGMSDAVRKRFSAESRLYDALVENDIARARLHALEENISNLKRLMQ